MKQRRRIYCSAAQRSEIWDRWQAGEAMSSIGRRFDRESSSVFGDLANRRHSSTSAVVKKSWPQSEKGPRPKWPSITRGDTQLSKPTNQVRGQLSRSTMSRGTVS